MYMSVSEIKDETQVATLAKFDNTKPIFVPV